MTTLPPCVEDIEPSPLTLLRAPVKPSETSKLPKVPKSRQQDQRSSCSECGGYHVTGSGVVHLDYMGHAAVTDRLLSVDPFWSWEPVAFDADGMPGLVYNSNGSPVGLWIRLTVAGVTRYGYGSTDPKADGVKELIGDAIRNAAMRFGVGLELWHKGDLHADDGPARESRQGAATSGPTTRERGGKRTTAGNASPPPAVDEPVRTQHAKPLSGRIAALPEEMKETFWMWAVTQPGMEGEDCDGWARSKQVRANDWLDRAEKSAEPFGEPGVAPTGVDEATGEVAP